MGCITNFFSLIITRELLVFLKKFYSRYNIVNKKDEGR
jgi:hypothetical protein